jgi:hypothetical protein
MRARPWLRPSRACRSAGPRPSLRDRPMPWNEADNQRRNGPATMRHDRPRCAMKCASSGRSRQLRQRPGRGMPAIAANSSSAGGRLRAPASRKSLWDAVGQRRFRAPRAARAAIMPRLRPAQPTPERPVLAGTANQASRHSSAASRRTNRNRSGDRAERVLRRPRPTMHTTGTAASGASERNPAPPAERASTGHRIAQTPSSANRQQAISGARGSQQRRRRTAAP